MREIKFRAWNKKIGKMVCPHKATPFALDADLHVEGVFLPFTTELTLMQYTGLKDKSGVEIFEGDVLAFSEDGLDAPEEWDRGVVKYHGDRDYPAFDIEPHIDCDSNGLSYIKATGRCKVLGNIFEHPHLTEGK